MRDWLRSNWIIDWFQKWAEIFACCVWQREREREKTLRFSTTRLECEVSIFGERRSRAMTAEKELWCLLGMGGRVTRDLRVARSRNKPISFELHEQRSMIPPEASTFRLTHTHTIDDYFSITFTCLMSTLRQSLSLDCSNWTTCPMLHLIKRVFFLSFSPSSHLPARSAADHCSHPPLLICIWSDRNIDLDNERRRAQVDTHIVFDKTRSFCRVIKLSHSLSRALHL